MCSTNWKQHLAILGLLIGLVLPATGRAGEVGRAEPRRSAAPAEEVAPAEKAVPAQEAAPAREAAPAEEATPARVIEPTPVSPGAGRLSPPSIDVQMGKPHEAAPAGPQQRMPKPPDGDTQPKPDLGSVGVSAVEVNPDLQVTVECGVGFVREIIPDQPIGYYLCRLPANPPCGDGFEWEAAFDKTLKKKFHYACREDAGSSADFSGCPSNWQKSTPFGWKFTCTSNQFACKPGYRVFGPAVSATPPIYKYRCNAE